MAAPTMSTDHAFSFLGLCMVLKRVVMAQASDCFGGSLRYRTWLVSLCCTT